MKVILITALGVGGSTIFGAAIGYFFRSATKKLYSAVLSFAAGVMLAAAIIGLIMSSLEDADILGFLSCLFGLFCGAFVLLGIGKTLPLLRKILSANKSRTSDRVLLFVCAIALHNLPEGIAAGVGFGTGDISDGITLALGIALQNIPEGMVLIAPMLQAGISPVRTFLSAAFTGVIEIVGTFVGFYAVSFSSVFLPFALALAGGSMLFVICGEMIPETCNSEKHIPVFCLLFGFAVMVALDFFI